MKLRLGNRIAPVRFITFVVLMAGGLFLLIPPLGWREGTMAAFDVAALVFLAACAPLLRYEAEGMREAAKRNDANRALLLVITGAVSIVVLVAVASELAQKGSPRPTAVILIVATLVLCWLFSNIVYTLHYAHLFYSDDAQGNDSGGVTFPGTKEPDYWDFIYLATCLGMTFQTSDMNICSGRMRRIVTGHCLLAFVFNLGILAFTINSLGGS
ncbi:DUF1345 domain-containing protein [Sphingomonas nostoxanthinifaciens]|uniref:DUF1345 domain-containing protein n=1 Tax=Sphingomonas nostoxanthinifaciens TaxID=2872652 RepID=UPI001CC1F93C|nr:DUF1345 domain-containing protein [Sphingomonas nostoxanthinifaciens]UAK26438.1 DUF1345 domain-containing protein [Sphingomonas nostoxanthinifaciens]